MLVKNCMEEATGNIRRSDQCRFRWTQKASEINFNAFVEGRHIANHVPWSVLLTNKFKFFEALRKLESLMAMGLIKSKLYTSTREFTLETFWLKKNSQLTAFMGLPNQGLWVLKNTSADKNAGITFLSKIDELKSDILDNVQNRLRTKLRAIVGTGTTKISDFSDSDEEDAEETKSALTIDTIQHAVKSSYMRSRSPLMSSSISTPSFYQKQKNNRAAMG